MQNVMLAVRLHHCCFCCQMNMLVIRINKFETAWIQLSWVFGWKKCTCNLAWQILSSWYFFLWGTFKSSALQKLSWNKREELTASIQASYQLITPDQVADVMRSVLQRHQICASRQWRVYERNWSIFSALIWFFSIIV